MTAEKRNDLIWVAILLLAGFAIVASQDKMDLHAWMNTANSSLLDPVFLLLNKAAESWGIVLALLVGLALYGTRFFTYLGLTLLSCLMVVQTLKHQVFEHMKRPHYYFGESGIIDYVHGVDMHNSFAFPSGHATTIFAICTCFAMISPNRRVRVVLYAFAAFVSYSRVYVSQHFAMDLFGGAILGLALSVGCFYLIYEPVRLSRRRKVMGPVRSAIFEEVHFDESGVDD